MKNRTGWVTVAATALALVGCSGTAPQGSAQSAEEGSAIELNLSTIAPSGTEYRLGPASFQVIPYGGDQTTTTLTADGSSPKLHAALPKGGYRVVLEPNWTLSRVDSAGATPVLATLTSPAEQNVYIEQFQTVPVSFAFHLGESGIDIGVTVDEGVPSGYDANLLPDGQLEFVGGYFTCCYSSLADAQAAFPYLKIHSASN